MKSTIHNQQNVFMKHKCHRGIQFPKVAIILECQGHEVNNEGTNRKVFSQEHVYVELIRYQF